MFCANSESPTTPPAQRRKAIACKRFSLLPVRSPLLGESRLIYFPEGTEMFHFPSFAFSDYEFIKEYRLSGGFPHSDIPGSLDMCSFPGLFAAYHVLHRLSNPRHPPCALSNFQLLDDFKLKFLILLIRQYVKELPLVTFSFSKDNST